MKSFAALIALASLSFCGCNTTKPEPASTNQQAELTGQLPYNPLAWKVVTSSVNRSNSTMSTLYGNDTAIAYARSTAGSSYPAGSVLALVTWAQRDDPHWFGAKIPATPQSVEFVSFPTPSGQPPTYEVYRGSPLARVGMVTPDEAGRRIGNLSTQRAAVMP
jgi:hypothetical protein